MVLGQLWDIFYLQSQSSFVVRIRHSTLFYPRIRWQWPLKIQKFNAKRTHFEGKRFSHLNAGDLSGFCVLALVVRKLKLKYKCIFLSETWWCGNWNWNWNVIFYQQTWWWGRPPFCWICPPMSSTWNYWFKYTSNHMRSIYTKTKCMFDIFLLWKDHLQEKRKHF